MGTDRQHVSSGYPCVAYMYPQVFSLEKTSEQIRISQELTDVHTDLGKTINPLLLCGVVDGVVSSRDTTPCRMTGVTLQGVVSSGNTTLCRMTGVT